MSEFVDMSGKIVIEIPHQRRAIAGVWLDSHDAGELEERWLDLYNHHVFETWKDALQWATNYRGHQAMEVRAAVRAAVRTEVDFVCGNADEGIGYLDGDAVEMWKGEVNYRHSEAEWTSPDGETYLLQSDGEWEG